MADESENSNGRAPRQRRAAMVNEEKGLLLRHIADLRNQRNKSTSPAVPLHHNNEAHINHRNESHNEYEAHDNGSIQQTHHRSGRIEHTVDSFWPSLDQNDARFFESSMDSGGSGSSSSFQSLPKARTVFQNEASSPSVTPDSKERAADCLVMTSVDRRTTKHDNHSLGGYSDRHKLIPPSGIDFQRRPAEKAAIAGRRRLCKVQSHELEGSFESNAESSPISSQQCNKQAESLHEELGRLSISRMPLKEVPCDGSAKDQLKEINRFTYAEMKSKQSYAPAPGQCKSKASKQKFIDLDSSSLQDGEYESGSENCSSPMPKANAFISKRNDASLDKFDENFFHKENAFTKKTMQQRELLDVSPCSSDDLNDLEISEGALTEMKFSDRKQEFLLCSKITTMLYPHQREGIKWLWGLHIKGMGGILGDDMGLGKTMQVAAFLSGLFSSRLIKRTLIVAPKTLIAHWTKELSVVGLQRKIRDYSGSSGNARDFSLQHVLQVGGILITTYDVVRHNWKALKGDYHGRDGFLDFSDDSLTWDYMVLDEGHLLKNPNTQRAKSLREIPSAHRIIISGTPIQNNLREMWALFDFCCPELLGDRKEFKYKYEDLILRGNDKHATDRQKRIGSSVAQELRQRAAPCLLRRLKSEVFPETDKSDRKLANKNDIIVWLRLSKEQRQLYTAFLNSETAHRSLDGSALASLTVLKKICDHPLLLTKRAADDIAEGLESTLNREDAAAAEAMTASLASILQAPEKSHSLNAESSCKIMFLMALLETLVKEGHRTLIFAQTRKMLNIIQDKILFEGYSWCRIDGTMKASDREKHVQDFQKDSRISIFLLTSQVGGLGLTLTGADRVVIVDPAWNPSMDNQSVDRAYRIGQLKDVVVYRLMTCGTIEEKIYRKQVFKGGLMKVATEQKEQFRYFSQQELRELLTVPETGFDISMTQQQLYLEHSSQCNIDDKLQQHINFLEAQGIAGVSYHDLLFSKEAPELPPAADDEEPHVHDYRMTNQKKSNSQQLERFFEPTKLGKGVSNDSLTNRTGIKISEADAEAQQAYEHVFQLQEKINRLSKTLADNKMISRLPDGGENIKKKLDALAIEHSQAELKAMNLRENLSNKKQIQSSFETGPSILPCSQQDYLHGQKDEICSWRASLGTTCKIIDMVTPLIGQKGEKHYESSFASKASHKVQSHNYNDAGKAGAIDDEFGDAQVERMSRALLKLQVID
ncbi:hypothetical protein O6H91_08G094800 [Diphasiastrum complanatum]|uniref:Uncharacterized protein n=1 Tax=Diphasiastrum complanatum TaxID=34168 RepID=A0ACC2D0Z4_DIPCM|nr:hypothetical protein O6H91_08G094800 [Diphasiastrum complanatum]